MRANLDVTGGLLMTESVVTALAPSLGHTRAQELVEDAARRSLDEDRPVRDMLAELPEVAESIGQEGLDAALAPESYLGDAGRLIDRSLEVHRG
jgi:3-carboxy-cis,cis-muconate cycloisomerase